VIEQLELFAVTENGGGPPEEPAVVLAPLVEVPAPPLHRVRRLSYSALSLFERCSYRYFAERVVGLRAADASGSVPGQTGLAATEIGDAVHALLERIDLKAPAVPEDLDDLVRARYPAATADELERIRGFVASYCGSERGARIEDADHNFLSVRGGQRRDTQVHARAIDGDAGAPALRPESIGDVHLAHDLDAGHERNADCLGKNHHFLEHPVDAIADGDAALTGFQVDVARARCNSLGHDVIDELYHRPLGLLLVYLVLGGVGSFDDGLDPGVVSAADQLAHALDGGVNLLDTLLDASGRSERHPDHAPGGERERLLTVEIVRVGRGDLERRLGDGERQNREPTGEAFANHLPRGRAHEQVARNSNVRVEGQGLENLFLFHEGLGHCRFPIARTEPGLEKLERGLRQQLTQKREKPAVARERLDGGRHATKMAGQNWRVVSNQSSQNRGSTEVDCGALARRPRFLIALILERQCAVP